MIPKPDFNNVDTSPSLLAEQLRMLQEENSRLRRSGAALAIAAMRVASEYDGTHRLMLAVAEWAKVMADENGRGVDREACAPRGVSSPGT